MKKQLLMLAAMATFGFAANAQDSKGSSSSEGGFKAGIHVGLPMGDIKDSYSFNLGLDVAYLWPVGDGFEAGVTTGYTTYFGKEETVNTGFGTITFKPDDAGFIPVAGTANYSFTENIFVGADLGYAIGVAPSGNDGGFLYQPKFGYKTSNFDAYLGYKGISVDGGTYSSLNLGFGYKF